LISFVLKKEVKSSNQILSSFTGLHADKLKHLFDKEKTFPLTVKRDCSARWFLCSLDKTYEEDLRSKIFWSKNSSRLNLMSLSVLGEYGKILLALSTFALKSFLRVLQIISPSFRVFGDDFVYRKQP
jgi:hypothetical protein